MGKKRFAKDPLLYIHQPTIRTPEAPMQDNYMTPKKSSANTNTNTNVPPEKPQPKARPIKRETYFKRELRQMKNEEKAGVADEHVTDDEATENLTPTDESEKGEKEGNHTKFKDMTLEEKVNYFVSPPSHVPKMKCEVQTDEKTYRGMISDYKENDVFIRVGRRTSSVRIPFDEITNIRMLGF